MNIDKSDVENMAKLFGYTDISRTPISLVPVVINAAIEDKRNDILARQNDRLADIEMTLRGLNQGL